MSKNTIKRHRYQKNNSKNNSFKNNIPLVSNKKSIKKDLAGGMLQSLRDMKAKLPSVNYIRDKLPPSMFGRSKQEVPELTDESLISDTSYQSLPQNPTNSSIPSMIDTTMVTKLINRILPPNTLKFVPGYCKDTTIYTTLRQVFGFKPSYGNSVNGDIGTKVMMPGIEPSEPAKFDQDLQKTWYLQVANSLSSVKITLSESDKNVFNWNTLMNTKTDLIKGRLWIDCGDQYRLQSLFMLYQLTIDLSPFFYNLLLDKVFNIPQTSNETGSELIITDSDTYNKLINLVGIKTLERMMNLFALLPTITDSSGVTIFEEYYISIDENRIGNIGTSTPSRGGRKRNVQNGGSYEVVDEPLTQGLTQAQQVRQETESSAQQIQQQQPKQQLPREDGRIQAFEEKPQPKRYGPFKTIKNNKLDSYIQKYLIPKYTTSVKSIQYGGMNESGTEMEQIFPPSILQPGTSPIDIDKYPFGSLFLDTNFFNVANRDILNKFTVVSAFCGFDNFKSGDNVGTTLFRRSDISKSSDCEGMPGLYASLPNSNIIEDPIIAARAARLAWRWLSTLDLNNVKIGSQNLISLAYMDPVIWRLCLLYLSDQFSDPKNESVQRFLKKYHLDRDSPNGASIENILKNYGYNDNQNRQKTYKSVTRELMADKRESKTYKTHDTEGLIPLRVNKSVIDADPSPTKNEDTNELSAETIVDGHLGPGLLWSGLEQCKKKSESDYPIDITMRIKDTINKAVKLQQALLENDNALNSRYYPPSNTIPKNIAEQLAFALPKLQKAGEGESMVISDPSKKIYYSIRNSEQNILRTEKNIIIHFTDPNSTNDKMILYRVKETKGLELTANEKSYIHSGTINADQITELYETTRAFPVTSTMIAEINYKQESLIRNWIESGDLTVDNTIEKLSKTGYLTDPPPVEISHVAPGQGGREKSLKNKIKKYKNSNKKNKKKKSLRR